MADHRQRAGGDRQQIAEQHRRVGRVAADDGGAREAADEGQRGDEDAVPQRHADREGRQRHRAAAGRDLGNHAVERDRREQRAIERGDAGRGQCLRHPVVARLRIFSAPPISAKPNSAARITRTSGER